MNTYMEENVEQISLPFPEQLRRDAKLKDGVQVQFPVLQNVPRTPRVQFSTTKPTREQSIQDLQTPSRSSVTKPGQEPDHLAKVVEKQHQLKSLLIKQQMLYTLPKGDLTAFDGNILQYKSFIHSFDHMIESRTDNNQDRLQFLIQYTKGQAQQLVKSCQHMDANRGYRKARELLNEYFSNAYKISCAYIEKALMACNKIRRTQSFARLFTVFEKLLYCHGTA